MSSQRERLEALRDRLKRWSEAVPLTCYAESIATVEEALRTLTPSATVAHDTVLVPRSLAMFLMGEADIEGVHFGEPNWNDKRGPLYTGRVYWWRELLREAMNVAAPAASPQQEAVLWMYSDPDEPQGTGISFDPPDTAFTQATWTPLYAAPQSVRTNAPLTEAASIKGKISEILLKVVGGQDVRYTLDGRYVRWGAVEKDILAAVDECGMNYGRIGEAGDA